MKYSTTKIKNFINKIITGDALEVLSFLPDGFVHCCITSPPYWKLRDYNIKGQLGMEDDADEYIRNLVLIFNEAKRILRKDGTLWVVMGDRYKGRLNKEPGSEKNLLGLPWRFAFAMQKQGWILRADVIWHKTNPMPEPVKDRPTRSHEYLFLFSRSNKYFYNREADLDFLVSGSRKKSVKYGGRKYNRKTHFNYSNRIYEPANLKGRNKRSVWTYSTNKPSTIHTAAFPERLIHPCIKLSTSRAGYCGVCGIPWKMDDNGFKKSNCIHEELKPQPGIVLDPFMGSGTTALACKHLGRSYLGIEINPDYAEMARKIISDIEK